MMEINLTLVGQMITFAIAVWFIMKYVWPPLIQALDARQKKIAEGIIAAEDAKKDREQALEDVKKIMDQARAESAQIVEQAHKRANLMIDQAKQDAQAEGQRLLQTAKAEIAREVTAAKETLREQVAKLAVAGASKILQREINAAANDALLNEIIDKNL